MPLIDYLPRAEEEASQQYQEIKENWYQFQTLGRSRNAEEGYACDCHYVRGISYFCNDVAVSNSCYSLLSNLGVTPEYRACGEGSDCINRLTQVECIEGECPSKAHCQNQRLATL
jgi:hypothetical protein